MQQAWPQPQQNDNNYAIGQEDGFWKVYQLQLDKLCVIECVALLCKPHTLPYTLAMLRPLTHCTLCVSVWLCGCVCCATAQVSFVMAGAYA